jgi:selenocysteine lyase/cysteine desulfurase
MAERPAGPFAAANLVVPLGERARGNFLTFADADAAAWHRRLHEARIVTDVRGERLRLGFGLYHTASDVDRLVERLRALA